MRAIISWLLFLKLLANGVDLLTPSIPPLEKYTLTLEASSFLLFDLRYRLMFVTRRAADKLI